MTDLRAPVLRPSARGGLGVPAALREQVRVTLDGAVEAVGPGTALQLAPGVVRRVVLLSPGDGKRMLDSDAHHGGTLVLLGTDDAPLLALQLLDWCPPAAGDETTLRETTGALALCQALGLPLEPADPQRLAAAALRRVLRRPGPAPRWPGRAAVPLTAVAYTLGVLTLLGAAAAPGGRVDEVIGEANGGILGLAAAVCAVLVAVPLVAGRLAAGRAVNLQGLDGRDRVIPARPAQAVPAGALGHELRLSAGRLLVRRYGTVVVLPAPARVG